MSLGAAIGRLQKAATGWKGFRHAAVKQQDLQLVLNELERLRVKNLRCVLEDHESLKAELEIARHVSSTDLNRLAQYFYEEVGTVGSGIHLVMPMTAKGDLVNALEKALARIGIRKVQHPNNWKVEYGHQDCAECEDMAEQAISYAKAANSSSEQMVKSAFGGHMGSAVRS